MKVMRKFVLTGVTASLLLAAGAAWAAPSADEMKRMGIFLSNFTEVGFFDIDAKTIGSDELVLFGIWHNEINNKKLIGNCKVKGCEWGRLTVSGQAVAASVQRYFDKELKHHSVDRTSFKCHYDGKAYHFGPTPMGTIYYAEVQKVSYEGNDTLRMTGELYNLKNKKERPAAFTALAKPHKWNKKETWAILSLKTDWR